MITEEFCMLDPHPHKCKPLAASILTVPYLSALGSVVDSDLGCPSSKSWDKNNFKMHYYFKIS